MNDPRLGSRATGESRDGCGLDRVVGSFHLRILSTARFQVSFVFQSQDVLTLRRVNASSLPITKWNVSSAGRYCATGERVKYDSAGLVGFLQAEFYS